MNAPSARAILAADQDGQVPLPKRTTPEQHELRGVLSGPFEGRGQLLRGNLQRRREVSIQSPLQLMRS